MSDINGNGINVSYERNKGLDSRKSGDHFKANQLVNDYSTTWLNQMEQKQSKINALIKEANKLQDGASKAQQNALQKQVDVLKEQLIIMERMKITGSATVEQQLEVDKKISKVWEEIANKQFEVAKADEKTSQKRLENLRKAKVQAEEINKQTQDALKDVDKALDNLQEKVSTKLAGEFKDLGNNVMNLMNTLNIDKIASSLGGTAATDKVGVMNSVKAQLGMSDSGFESFKDTLLNQNIELNKTIGKGLFNESDVVHYMSELNRIGITNQEMAKQQLEATLIGNKYLGVSNETQELLVTQMKRSGDTTLMQKHNNRVVALLNAQLGLTKEQIDAASESALTQADKLATLGWTQDEMNAYTDSSSALFSSIRSSLGDSLGQSIEGIFNNYVGADYESLVGVLGGQANQWTAALDKQDASGMLNALLGSDVYKAYKGMVESGADTSSISTGMKAFGENVDIGSLGSLYQLDTSGKYDEILANMGKATDAINAANDKKTMEFLQEQTISTLDEMKNNLSNWFGKISWKAHIALADVANGVIIASGLVSIVKNVMDIGKGIKGIITTAKGAKAAGSAANVVGGAAKTGLMSKLGSAFGVGKAAGGGTTLTSVLGSTGAKVLGGVGGGIALGVDAYKGVKKADEWGTSKTAAGIGGALGGTKSGVSGALGGAAKGAAIGTIFGPLGTAIGAAAGGILGAIGGENISKGLQWVGDGVKNLASKTGEFFSKTGEKIGDWWSNKKDEFKKGWEAIGKANDIMKDKVKEFASNAKDKIKDFASNAKEKFSEFKDGALKGIKNGLSKGWEKVKGWFSGGGIGGPGASFGYGGGGADYSHKPWPITAGYPKYPSGKSHKGVDFGVSRGTPIGSSVSGTVETVKSGITREGWLGNTDGGGWGNHVRVRGLDGNLYTFAHLSATRVSKGDKIDAGTLIGLSGNTGSSTGPHLHYQVNSATGTVLDPYNFFSNSMYNPGDASGISSYATQDGSTAISNQSSNKAASNLAARSRYISPGLLEKIGGYGIGGSVNITGSANSAADRIIAKLDELATRQDEQAAFLQAFSNSNNIPKEFGGAY